MITSEFKKLPFFTPAKTNRQVAKFWKRDSILPEDEGKLYVKSLIAFMKSNSQIIGANVLKGIVRDIVESGDLHSRKAQSFFSELEIAIVNTQTGQEHLSNKESHIEKPKRRYGFTLSEAANEINVSSGRLLSYMVNNEWLDVESIQPTEEALARGMLRKRRELPFVITNKGLALLRSKKVLFS
ncbi:TPA: hypothetical protein MB324_001947 [Klebsiella pneumoniae]|nr:hypothetical protein [Klebsiella pneumoniae]